MIYIFLFFVGLAVGSYLNVVVLRLAKNESPQRGRSYCFSCEHSIAWYDNIPLLSFVMLSGRCRHCQCHIDWQYPLVEAVTAGAFVVTGLMVGERFGYSPQALTLLLWMLCTVTFIILIAVYDLRYMQIPVIFLWLANASAVIFFVIATALHWYDHWFFPPSGEQALLGAFAAGGFLFLLVYFSRETWMGWGDVWLGTWSGMIVGIALVQVYLTIAFVLGAGVGLYLLYRQKKGLKSEIPFAPYLLLALVGVVLLEWYTPAVFSFLLPWFPATM